MTIIFFALVIILLLFLVLTMAFVVTHIAFSHITLLPLLCLLE